MTGRDATIVRMPGRLWTLEDVRELGVLRARGLSPAEIAASLGRSRQAVNVKIHALGLPRPTRIRRENPSVRFWRQVEKTNGCWLWTGCLFASGYGSFWDGGRNVRAHRFAYRDQVGPIPEGAELLHSCDTPTCVNPTHLSPGTHAANMGESSERGRAAAGERSPSARLTRDQVRAIKQRLAEGESQSAIARSFDVATVTVHWIAAGKTWKDVEP